MIPVRLESFLAGLRAHARAPAVALVELLQRASDDGVLDRGEWLAALTQSVAPAVPAGGTPTEHDAEELRRYIEENVVARLVRDGIAIVEPAGEAWERVRVEPTLWQEVVIDRAEAIERARERCRRLEQGDRPTVMPPHANGGSSLSATIICSSSLVFSTS